MKKAYAQIHIIFPIYEKQFYKLLVPYIIDELKKRTITSQKGKTMPMDVYLRYVGVIYKTTTHDVILDIAKKLFDYLFPVIMYPHLEKPNKNSNFSYTIAKNKLSSTRHHITGSTIYLKLLDVINQQIINIILKKQDINKLYPKYREEIEKLRENILARPVIEVENEKLKNKTRTSYDNFKDACKDFGLQKLKREDIIDSRYYEYQKSFELRLNQNAVKDLSTKIKTFVLNELIQKEVSKSQIDILTFKIRTGKDTLNSVYNYYLEQRRIELATQQKTTPFNSDLTIEEFNKIIGYKGANKRKALTTINYGQSNINDNYINFETSNRFPLKENKHYQLHTIAPRFSYIIDLMFENKEYCYLVAININTRKIWVEKTNFEPPPIAEEQTEEQFAKLAKASMKNAKSTENIKRALEKILAKMKKENTTIKHLRGDGKSAFQSKLMKETFYDINEIDFVEVQREATTKYPEFMYKNHMVKSIRNKHDSSETQGWKTEPKHSSLGLIDRAIRTIRDLAFNMKVGIITPKIMKIIVWQYNNAPHDTLSKYAGKPVSPNEVDSKPELEAFIVRRIQQDNFNIMTKSNYDIKEGIRVKIYNERNNMMKRRSEIEDGKWSVNRRIGPLFEVIDEHGNTQIKSRYQISPYYY